MLRTSAVLIGAALLVAGCSTSTDLSSPSGDQAVYGPASPPRSSQAQAQQASIREVPVQQEAYQQGQANAQMQGQGNLPEQQQPEQAEQAGYTQMPSGLGNQQIVPQVNTETGDLRLVNNSDQDVTNIELTANGNYFATVGRIPAHGSVILSRNDFTGPAGAFANSSAPVQNLQIKANGQSLSYRNILPE